MNRRPFAAAMTVAIAMLGVGIALALRAPGPGVARPLQGSTHAGGLIVSIPHGFRNYRLHAYDQAVIGHVLTNFRVPARHPSGWPSTIEWVLNRWSAASATFIAVKKHNYGPPSNEVALELTQPEGPMCHIDVCNAVRLHLPLDQSQAWDQARLASGAPGFRSGYFRFDHKLYFVRYWIGADAPANDRAAVLDALQSIRPA